jgi:hypothetical protein
MIEGLFFLIVGLAAIYIALWLFILLPARMAEARGRSAIGWVLVSLFFSPILAVLMLWVLGDAPDRNA